MYQEAIARYPEHHEWYTQMAMHLLPRWGGAPGEWQRYAASLPGSEPKEYGRELLARVVAQNEWYEPDMFDHAGPVTWPELRAGLLAWHERHPASTRPMSEYARLAAVTGNVGEARTAMAALGDTIDLHAWMTVAYYRDTRAWLESRQQPDSTSRR